MMEKFEFLLGDWNLEYRIPKSPLSEAATGSGSGIFRRALDGRFVYFDYVSLVNEERGSAHGVFGWDGKSEIHRYWWFENSGSFLTATTLWLLLWGV
ncbi:MAG: DUF1579 domain-containing protein [Acidobacteria bacterium]|nr:DUF1579 domain-containing protein [Acidobacteriota bacterium]MBU4330340.1 DUF1579 domain-containing protein [Acidobacteriota bacterium]MBU4494558.1 DUF1579 domain-containing protein [Acidobacteriota bacterium]